MKNFIAFFLIIIIQYSSKSQNLETVIDNLNFVWSIEVENDNLFFSIDDGDGPNGELSDSFIYKLNLAEENQSVQEIVTTQQVFDPVDFLIDGNDMYIAEYLGNRISKINTTANSPVPIVIANNLGNVSSLAISGNQLYYCDPISNLTISKLDLNETSPTPSIVVPSEYNPKSIAIKDNYLYFSSSPPPYGNPSPVGKIYKIDITQQNPIPEEVLSGLIYLYNGRLKFHGNDLYFYNDNKISRVDISNELLTIVDVFSTVDFGGMRNMIIDGDYLYIASSNKIIRANLLTLSTTEFELSNKIKLAPNPSNDFINLTGLKNKMEYKIYDINGRLLDQNTINLHGKINIQDLNKGLYFIQFDNKSTLRFIKN